MQLECKPVELPKEVSPGAVFHSKDGGDGQCSDEELVIAAQNGESCALGELLNRHRKILFCVARRYTANADEAHDLIQEAMLRAVRNITRFRGECRFLTWLNSIVINTARSQKRKEKNVRWINLDEKNEEDARFCVRSLRDLSRNPEEEYSHRELRGLLRRAARRLAPKDRFILKACDLEDSSIKEVARSLGLHLCAANSRLHRARWRLSVAVKKTGADRATLQVERR
jgi:RNA polymerase sigma-70 factor (ECF subfamily)